MAELRKAKPSKSSNPSRNVRIIGKIRGFADGKDCKPSWVAVKKPQEEESSEKCKIFIGTQTTSRKGEYELDDFYGHDDDGSLIYEREIKPMVVDLFNGKNSSVIALGARGSGKTFIVQGSQEKPGLATMAMSEILLNAEGSRKSVMMSLYEVAQDRVYDLLNPKNEVYVLEDHQGQINLKGLSKLPVKSISEFCCKMYVSQSGSQLAQKTQKDQQRCHKGLIVHLVSEDEKPKSTILNKMHFVDLAGYEDPKKASRDGGITPSESNRINKSLYGLVKVVHAINSNENRVPYRESKLTRILQDSLGGAHYGLLIACLNPSFCQDSVSLLNLVTRTSQCSKEVLTDSTNGLQSSPKPKLPSIALKIGRMMPISSLSAKNKIGQSSAFSGKSGGDKLKGRKLFDKQKPVSSMKKLECKSENASVLKSKLKLESDLSIPPILMAEIPQDISISDSNSVSLEGCAVSYVAEQQSSPSDDAIVTVASLHDGTYSNTNTSLEGYAMSSVTKEPSNQNDYAIVTEVSSHSGTDDADPSPVATSDAKIRTCKDEDVLPTTGNKSPPLSEQIREISNGLKSLLSSSTPLRTLALEAEIYRSSSTLLANNDIVDPKTPAIKPRQCSPKSGNFSNRSCRVKQSLVKEYLSFLNSANKEELKSLKGIGEKRATTILQLREESPEPFKSLDDLQDIGLSAKQIKGMMKQAAGSLFN